VIFLCFCEETLKLPSTPLESGVVLVEVRALYFDLVGERPGPPGFGLMIIFVTMM
jgi:hypothetical protein